jgi:hypothetical protein
MSDVALFFFGLTATIFTLGPLAIAAIYDLRERNSDTTQTD